MKIENLKVTVVAMNRAIVESEDGKKWEVEASFHARRLKNEYKYHEVYVYLNKIDEFECKAPKTLKQKWYQVDTKKFKGPKLIGYNEIIGSTNRCNYDIDELEFV